MFWFVFVIVVIIYVCNVILVMCQMRNFFMIYILLCKCGKVVIGKQKNVLSWGVIVMFLFDDRDCVVVGCCMNGIIVLVRFRDFLVFDGLFFEEIDFVYV